MIIGISGTIGSGKDTIGKIIQWLSSEKLREVCLHNLAYYLEDGHKLDNTEFENWEIKKFADKLKDIVCMLIGCTREQLEDLEFKNKELGEEWIRYAYASGFTKDTNGKTTMLTTDCDKERYELELRINWQTAYKVHYTPRLLLQRLGTEAGRNIIHPNIWINATFADYIGLQQTTLSKECPRQDIYDITEADEIQYGKIETIYPDWIITDDRYFNEDKAIEHRKGLRIRVLRSVGQRPLDIYEELWRNNSINEAQSRDWEEIIKDYHDSEIALRKHNFDYVVINNGTIGDLVDKIKDILIKENIINVG